MLYMAISHLKLVPSAIENRTITPCRRKNDDLRARDASADPDFAHMERLLRSVKTVPFIDDTRPDQQEIRDRAK